MIGSPWRTPTPVEPPLLLPSGQALTNPYLDEFLAWERVAVEQEKAWRAWYSSGRPGGLLAGPSPPSMFPLRDELAKKYAWAVPCPSALKALLDCGPLLEVGAGAGYWAHLLRQLGADVLAYDAFPPAPDSSANHWHPWAAIWTEVLPGGPEECSKHPGRVLFLCWPPYDDPMAANCLKAYRGRRVAFVGEGEGGCTADAEFFAILEGGWEEWVRVRLPQWNGIHDGLTVYEKKERT